MKSRDIIEIINQKNEIPDIKQQNLAEGLKSRRMSFAVLPVHAEYYTLAALIISKSGRG
jgi:hypothetical protein